MPTSNVVRSVVVKAADAAFTSNPVKGMRYEDCIIQGPAVLIFLGDTELESCSFEGDAEAMLWEIAPDRASVLGAVGFENCVFHRCQFRAVGIGGNREFIENFTKKVLPAEGAK